MNKLTLFFAYLFPFTFAAKIARLEKKKQAALSIFTKTLSDIDKLNIKVDTEMAAATKKMAELTAFHTQLHAHQTANNAIVGKINYILTDDTQQPKSEEIPS